VKPFQERRTGFFELTFFDIFVGIITYLNS
jgi:hypothetical protein